MSKNWIINIVATILLILAVIVAFFMTSSISEASWCDRSHDHCKTSTPTATSTETNTPQPTATSTETNTPQPTATSTETNTPQPTATSTATNTPQPTATAAPLTPQPTATAAPISTSTPVSRGETYYAPIMANKGGIK